VQNLFILLIALAGHWKWIFYEHLKESYWR